MLVYKENYFHISKSDFFELGKNYEFGLSYNPFFQYFWDFGYGDTLEWDEIKQLVSDYQLYVRECIFESVRVKHFPDLPSRKKCIWLISPENKDSAIKYWAPLVNSTGAPCTVIEMECTGKIFIADSLLLPHMFGHFQKQKEQAFKYWSGENAPQSFLAAQEILFVGTATVVRIEKI